jgi:hypothetical protein
MPLNLPAIRKIPTYTFLKNWWQNVVLVRLKFSLKRLKVLGVKVTLLGKCVQKVGTISKKATLNQTIFVKSGSHTADGCISN